MEIKYFKSPARLLNRDYFNKRGLDLSKEVLWVSVGQRVTDLRAVKVGGQQSRFRFFQRGTVGLCRSKGSRATCC